MHREAAGRRHNRRRHPVSGDGARDGVPIDRYCDTHRLSRAARLKLFLQVCEAVQYAHRNLVVHQDIKPGNILIASDGSPSCWTSGSFLTSEGRAATIRADARASRSRCRADHRHRHRHLLAGRIAVRALAQSPALSCRQMEHVELIRAICAEPPVWRPAELIRGDLHSILAQALRKEPTDDTCPWSSSLKTCVAT